MCFGKRGLELLGHAGILPQLSGKMLWNKQSVSIRVIPVRGSLRGGCIPQPNSDSERSDTEMTLAMARQVG